MSEELSEEYSQNGCEYGPWIFSCKMLHYVHQLVFSAEQVAQSGCI